jgi:hypothetical protein
MFNLISIQWETRLFHGIIIWGLFSGFHGKGILAFLAPLTMMAASHEFRPTTYNDDSEC